jgi:hypothetical protein
MFFGVWIVNHLLDDCEKGVYCWLANVGPDPLVTTKIASFIYIFLFIDG